MQFNIGKTMPKMNFKKYMSTHNILEIFQLMCTPIYYITNREKTEDRSMFYHIVCQSMSVNLLTRTTTSIECGVKINCLRMRTLIKLTLKEEFLQYRQLVRVSYVNQALDTKSAFCIIVCLTKMYTINKIPIMSYFFAEYVDKVE